MFTAVQHSKVEQLLLDLLISAHSTTADQPLHTLTLEQLEAAQERLVTFQVKVEQLNAIVGQARGQLTIRRIRRRRLMRKEKTP